MVKIINQILESGEYPEELITAKIIPVYKKYAHDDVNNYRPISLLSTFSKIVDKIIKTRLIFLFLHTFNLMLIRMYFKRKIAHL